MMHMNFTFGVLIVLGVIVFIAFEWLASVPKSDRSIRKELDKQKRQAMRPEVSPELLRAAPNDGDFVLGKYKDKYVCWDTAKDSHILVIGGSGSGKSSCLVLPFLLANPQATVFAIDIKGELVRKGRYSYDPNLCVFDPYDENSYGFDPFYNLPIGCSQQKVFSTMQTISYSLISLSDSKESFWPKSARNMLTGLLIYYFNSGKRDLIACIDAVLGSPIKEQIDEVINTVDPRSKAYSLLITYYDMGEDTLLSVFSNLTTSLACFSDDKLRRAFSSATRKVSPLTLETKKSVFLCIPEHKLALYSGALAMMVNLTLNELSKRPETSHRIFILLDELGRIISGGGAMEGLIDASMTLRSRKVTLCLVVQQIESLMTGFSENKVITLIGNCNIKIVLDASSSKTQKTVCSDWAPKYQQRKHGTTAGKSNSSSYSYDEKPVLTPSDLMELTRNGEEVVITPYGYSMLKKCPYYEDPFFKPTADKISRSNSGGKSS